MSGPTAILVDRDSARNGREWEQAINDIPVNRNHSELVKFHRHEEDYEWISSRLRPFVIRASEVIAQRFPLEDTSLSTKTS
jgi:hypothetical protein